MVSAFGQNISGYWHRLILANDTVYYSIERDYPA